MSAHAQTRMCQHLSVAKHSTPRRLQARLQRQCRNKSGRWSLPFSSTTLASTAVKPDRQDKERRSAQNSFRVDSEKSSQSSSTNSKAQTASQQKSKAYSASSNASLPPPQHKSLASARSVECHSSVEAASLEETEKETESSSNGLLVAGGALAGGLGLLLWAGVTYQDQINDILDAFSARLDGQGSLAYVYFTLVYTALEILCVPAIPLTVSAGVLFGTIRGTAVVSVSSTVAAGISFLLARYLLRERVEDLAQKSPKFAAIDKKVGTEGFKFVGLLRLSPLLPMAVSNYLYGLTGLKFKDYILGSWLGMLPGTTWYVMAGSVGRTALKDGLGEGVAGGGLVLGLGVACSIVTASYVTNVIKSAIDSSDPDPEEMN